MSNYAFGHAIRIKSGKTIDYRFQNFFVGKSIKYKDELLDLKTKIYSFVPFGFSGVTVTRTGDGLEASIVFPNNDLSRQWVIQAVLDAVGTDIPRRSLTRQLIGNLPVTNNVRLQ